MQMQARQTLSCETKYEGIGTIASDLDCKMYSARSSGKTSTRGGLSICLRSMPRGLMNLEIGVTLAKPELTIPNCHRILRFAKIIISVLSLGTYPSTRVPGPSLDPKTSRNRHASAFPLKPFHSREQLYRRYIAGTQKFF